MGSTCEKNNTDDPSSQGDGNSQTSVIDESILDDVMTKSSAELTAADIYKIVQTANLVTVKKIDDLSRDVCGKISVLENRVKILETENEKKDEDIGLLKSTVINMQRALNSTDQETRNLNAIITALPETNMELEDKTILTTDADKFHALFKVMGCTHLDDDKIENLVIKRCVAVRNVIEH